VTGRKFLPTIIHASRFRVLRSLSSSAEVLPWRTYITSPSIVHCSRDGTNTFQWPLSCKSHAGYGNYQRANQAEEVLEKAGFLAAHQTQDRERNVGFHNGALSQGMFYYRSPSNPEFLGWLSMRISNLSCSGDDTSKSEGSYPKQSPGLSHRTRKRQ
jgi:hypothetical protein